MLCLSTFAICVCSRSKATAPARKSGGPMMDVYRAFVSASLRQGWTMQAAGQLWKRSSIRRCMVENMPESERKRRKFELDP